MAPPEAKSQECRFPRDKRGQGRRRGVSPDREVNTASSQNRRRRWEADCWRAALISPPAGVCAKKKNEEEEGGARHKPAHPTFPLALLGVLITDMSFSTAANEECQLQEYCGYDIRAMGESEALSLATLFLSALKSCIQFTPRGGRKREEGEEGMRNQAIFAFPSSV